MDVVINKTIQLAINTMKEKGFFNIDYKGFMINIRNND